MPHGTGDADIEDVMGWAHRAIKAGMRNAGGGPPTAYAGEGGVSVGGLDSPLPGGGFASPDNDGGAAEETDLTAEDPAEVLRAAKDAIDRLEAIELGEGAPPKLQKRLDDLRDALSEQSDELEDLATDVEDFKESEGSEDGEGEEDEEGDDQGTDDDEELGPEDENDAGGEKPGDEEDDEEPDEDEDDEDEDEE